MHPGYEFLYILDGELELHHGEHHCTLGPGDAVYFDSSTPHSYVCAGKKPADALIVTMHQPPPSQPVTLLRSEAARRSSSARSQVAACLACASRLEASANGIF